MTIVSTTGCVVSFHYNLMAIWLLHANADCFMRMQLDTLGCINLFIFVHGVWDGRQIGCFVCSNCMCWRRRAEEPWWLCVYFRWDRLWQGWLAITAHETNVKLIFYWPMNKSNCAARAHGCISFQNKKYVQNTRLHILAIHVFCRVCQRTMRISCAK